MPYPYTWGVARFGKDDGFAMTEQLGALMDFDTLDAQAKLSHTLQLRQEEIRPFAGAEILGLTTLSHRRNFYRFLTLYRYSLDRYKRDGYTALTLALKNCRADSRDWLMTLRLLAREGATPADSGFPNDGHAPFTCKPDHVRGGATLPASIFIPLAEGSLDEESTLLDAWQQRLEAEYRYVYTSASPQVRASVDTRRITVWASNPFWRMAPVVSVAGPPSTSNGGHTHRPNPRSLTQTSLVHAYEDGTDYEWSNPSPASHPMPPAKRPWPWLLWGSVVATGLLLGAAIWWLS